MSPRNCKQYTVSDLKKRITFILLTQIYAYFIHKYIIALQFAHSAVVRQGFLSKKCNRFITINETWVQHFTPRTKQQVNSVETIVLHQKKG